MTDFDVVVLGSGAAGLIAAVVAADQGSRVLVAEKAALIGGTTALSFGCVWIPGNSLARASGIKDSCADGFRYLMSLSNDLMDPSMVRQLLDHGQTLLDFLRDVAGLDLSLVEGYPDYHPEVPGSLPGGGRTVDVGLARTADIGDLANQLVGVPRRIKCQEAPTGGGSGS